MRFRREHVHPAELMEKQEKTKADLNHCSPISEADPNDNALSVL
jgi:hypothetical protein